MKDTLLHVIDEQPDFVSPIDYVRVVERTNDLHKHSYVHKLHVTVDSHTKVNVPCPYPIAITKITWWKRFKNFVSRILLTHWIFNLSR